MPTNTFDLFFTAADGVDKTGTTLVSDKVLVHLNPSYFSFKYFYIISGIEAWVSKEPFTLRQIMFFCEQKSYNFSTAEIGYSDTPIKGIINVQVASISLSATSLTPIEGDTNKLTATVLPADATTKTVTWSSSAPTFVSVDNAGNWNALKPGTATITATSNNGKIATCAFTVAARTISVTGVSVDTPTINPTEGNTGTIVATVSPSNATNKAVTWSSSDNAIITVDNTGKWTAVKAGTATITVKTTDGNKTATTTATVKALVINVTGVTVDNPTISAKVNDTGKITPTVSPANTTNKAVTWTSDKPEIVSVDASGNYTAKAEGVAIITVKTTDGNKTATSTITVTPQA